MRIYIGADHRGYQLKKKIIAYLEKNTRHTVVDVGTDTDGTSCDYPKISHEVAREVALSPNNRGILVCMTGIGHTVAANKVPGVYAALCYNKQAAELAREHNNTNVLVLGAKFVSQKAMLEIIRTWLSTRFAGGRHRRRVNQIKRIEREYLK